jgi:DNA-directed RNA polymerase
VVKQPVMTYTYNVTRHGAAAQIAEQLADGLPNVRERYATAQYLTKLVLDSVGQLGPAAKNILDWLLGCARTMMAAENARPIEWTTPLGFPVFQPQQKHPSIAIECVRHNIKLAQHAETSPPKKGKQVDAIGPNLIHSLDATHMMLTALEAGHAGMPFAAVHDSFWTTAGHMPALSGTIRRTFVDLHSHDVLADWRQQQVSRTGIELPQPPERGSFDINSVLSSLYFFA